jgi:hypothetical protein
MSPFLFFFFFFFFLCWIWGLNSGLCAYTVGTFALIILNIVSPELLAWAGLKLQSS